MRAHRLAIAGSVLLVALYAWLAIASPNALGFFGDDAIYATTAQALADGRGYRHPSLPGEPLQTKYPPAYPALLALLMRAGAELPDGIGWLRLPGALAGAGAVLLAALYWRRVLGAPPGLVAAVAVLAGLSPVFLGFTRYTMSELPYAFLATAALLCFDDRAERSEGRTRRVWLALGAALVAGAMLTRSIGITLALATVAVPLLRRRFLDAALVAGVVAVLVAPWMLWQAAAAAENGALAQDFFTAYDLEVGSGAYLPDGPLEALRVAWQNLLRLAFGLGWFQLALPLEFMRKAMSGGGARLWLLHALCWGALGLVVYGFWRSAREGVRTLHVYALVYGGLAMIWTFSPHRFLVPWTPFLLFFGATGLHALLGLALRHPRAALAARGAVYAAVLALFLVDDGRTLLSREEEFYARERSRDLGELRDIERFLRERTAPGDIVASAQPQALFLATGRRGYYLWPDTDPVAWGYSPERDASRFTTIAAPAEARGRIEELRRDFGRAYAEAGIDWYVEWSELPAARAMAQLVLEHPAWFELVHTTPKRAYRIFRVHAPGAAAR
jgi:4-amino-4-deoxy-L-arabinose transferase-like glycosyltransferase